MEMEIKRDSENKLFGRREITFTASYTGKTPSREDVKEEICRRLGLSPDLTMIIAIHQLYGTGNSEVLAYSYSDKEGYERLVKLEAKKREKAKASKEKKTGATVKDEPAKETKKETTEEPQRRIRRRGDIHGKRE